MINSKPITQRAKSSPFKAMPIPPELIETLASSVISGIGSGSGKKEEEEPVEEAEKKEPAKPATFAQSLVAGIEGGKQKK